VGSWWEALHGAGTSDLLAVGNRGGPVGALLNLACRVICGSAWCWLVPLLLLGEGVGRLLQRGGFAWAVGRRAIPLWLTSTAWVAQPEGIWSPATAAAWGGVVGVWLGRGFHTLFGLWGGRIFLSFLLLTSLVLLLRPWLGPLMRRLVPVGRRVLVFVGRAMLAMVRVLLVVLRGVVVWPVRQLRGLGTQAEQASHTHAPRATSPRDQVYSTTENKTRRRVHGIDASTVSAKATGGEDAAEVLASSAVAEMAPRDIPSPPARIATPVRRDRPIVLPGLELLREPDPDFQPPKPAKLDASADLLESTLRSFGVEGEVKDVRPGPVVTTFEYQPASGTKVSQIVQRSDDLALAMKARTIRMEAPIPGKAAVGIEIPNPFTQIVRLKELLQGARNIPRTPLSVVLGKDVVGNPVVIDIAKLPHLLVAGSTGSGKSVCLNSMICNLLLYNGPDRVRLVLIDPKMLEMSVYNGIPHLLMPVVTDPKEALRALKWMVAQMELRYRLLARAGVRDIAAYNVKVERGEVEGLDGEPVSDYMPFSVSLSGSFRRTTLARSWTSTGPKSCSVTETCSICSPAVRYRSASTVHSLMLKSARPSSSTGVSTPI
jgi:hypothetical protein